MMIFTNDEMNLMCIYDTGTRTGLIDAMSEMKKELAEGENELRDMTNSAIDKLKAMTDEEYGEMEFYPDFNNEE
jgi:undecaprenyl pyrophosphate synthase